VSNPLEQEVRERYPDVYQAASEIVVEVSPLGDAIVPPDEIGFLTMYLAGSLERNRLRPKIRVTVVCPAGMATAWILVSRLLAVFPQVEVSRVVSKTVFEHGPDDNESQYENAGASRARMKSRESHPGRDCFRFPTFASFSEFLSGCAVGRASDALPPQRLPHGELGGRYPEHSTIFCPDVLGLV